MHMRPKPPDHRHRYINTKRTIDIRDTDTAHKHCSGNRKELLASEICGCFYCLAIFPPGEIDGWWDAEQTATCPYCGIDSVLGDSCGYPITPIALSWMEKTCFCSPDSILDKHRRNKMYADKRKGDDMSNQEVFQFDAKTEKECLFFLSAGGCTVSSIKNPYVDPKALPVVKEIIQQNLDEGYAVRVFVYDKAFRIEEVKERFIKRVAHYVEGSIDQKIEGFLADTFMFETIDESSLEDAIEVFVKETLKINKEPRRAFFIDAKIKENNGGEFVDSKGDYYMIPTPGREAPEYSTYISVKINAGAGISVSQGIEAESLDKLKTHLNNEGLSTVSMESLSPFDSIHSYRSNVPVEKITQRDYRWLTECVDYEDRYMII